MAGWFGLEALLNRSSSKKTFHADDLFNSELFVRIPNVRCMPVGLWFNQFKQPAAFNGNTFYLTLDQIPVMYSPTAVIDAIKRLPKYFPAHDEILSSGTMDNDFWKNVPQFYVTNARLERFQNQHWLFIDLLCLNDDPPTEFRSLTKMRRSELVDYAKDCNDSKAPWPENWGVSGMEVDFLPNGKGCAELTNNGLHIKTLEIINFLALAAQRYIEPRRLSWLWRGEHMFKELGCRAAPNYAKDHLDKEWNPIFQLPREHWERFIKS